MKTGFEKNAIKTWEKNGYIYCLFKNKCMPGYNITKYNSTTGEEVDYIIGAAWYSLVYYFEHQETRYDNQKDF